MNNQLNIDKINFKMKDMQAADRIKYACDIFKLRVVLTTSGGSTSAILPHMTRDIPIPVIFIDTGFYPKQTYNMVTKVLPEINPRLLFFPPPVQRADVEKRYKNWNNPESEDYKNVLELVKVSPLNRVLKDLDALAWMSGVMAHETDRRKNMEMLEFRNNIFHFHPLLDWRSDKAMEYITSHGLPTNTGHYDIFKKLNPDCECGIHDKCGLF